MWRVVFANLVFFVVISSACDVSQVVQWADSQWNCGTLFCNTNLTNYDAFSQLKSSADPTCASTVPAGSAQPRYACAEFAARSLAYGGSIFK